MPILREKYIKAIVEVGCLKNIAVIILMTLLMIQHPVLTSANTLPEEEGKFDSAAPYTTEDVNRIYIVTHLSPYTTKPLKDHYGINLPWQLEDGKIIDAKMIYGQDSLTFIFKLQVQPFVGAHNPVGTDNFTFRIQDNKITLEKYEHVESFPVPPHLKQQYKNLKQNY